MHKRMVEPVLARLDEEKSAYFNDIVTRLGKDPRIDRFPNVVFLVLKETMEFVPVYLDKEGFIEALIRFSASNQVNLRHIIFDKEFVYDSSCVKEVTDKFVTIIVDLTLQKYERGEINDGDFQVQRYTWPYRAADLIDPDDEDADEPEPSNYNGPKRRQSD